MSIFSVADAVWSTVPCFPPDRNQVSTSQVTEAAVRTLNIDIGTVFNEDFDDV